MPRGVPRLLRVGLVPASTRTATPWCPPGTLRVVEAGQRTLINTCRVFAWCPGSRGRDDGWCRGVPGAVSPQPRHPALHPHAGHGKDIDCRTVPVSAPAQAKMGERDSREEILKAFRLFDDDSSGTITFRDLKRVAKELGENLTGGCGLTHTGWVHEHGECRVCDVRVGWPRSWGRTS